MILYFHSSRGEMRKIAQFDDKCNLRSPTATGAVVNGHSAVCQRPA